MFFVLLYSVNNDAQTHKTPQSPAPETVAIMNEIEGKKVHTHIHTHRCDYHDAAKIDVAREE
jgi:hypothetical protein